MKLLIFGATGGTGRLVVQQALAMGHSVTAFVRNPDKLGLSHQHLSIFKGDVLDVQSVNTSMKGHEAVLSCLGSPANKIGTVRSEGTANIILAMQQHGISRFICQTSLGYGDSVKVLDRTSFFFKYIIVPFVLKKGFADHALQESYIRKSGLDWTIVRPGNLTDGHRTGSYGHGFMANDKQIKVKISRADVAEFMLAALTDKRYHHKAPGISY